VPDGAMIFLISPRRWGALEASHPEERPDFIRLHPRRNAASVQQRPDVASIAGQDEVGWRYALTLRSSPRVISFNWSRLLGWL
jgi:hypothetical protein